jgi:hypothetical protein
MQGSKGIVIGFVAGLVAMGGAVLLLRDDPAGVGAPDGAHIARLDAQIQRLEATVSRLSILANVGGPVASTSASAPASAAAASPTPAEQAEEAERRKASERASVTANTMVEQALQAGQWTRAQQQEFNLVASDLEGDEHARLLARISAAINRDELQVELP